MSTPRLAWLELRHIAALWLINMACRVIPKDEDGMFFVHLMTTWGHESQRRLEVQMAKQTKRSWRAH